MTKIAMLVDLVGSKEPYSEPSFYRYYSRCPAQAAQLLRRQYPATAHARGGTTADCHAPKLKIDKEIERISKELGPRFIVLLADPGIACRLSSFYRFARKLLQQQPTIRCDALRGAYSKSLGTQRVFRGLRMTEAQMIDSRKTGLLPPAFLEKGQSSRMISSCFDSSSGGTFGDPITQIRSRRVDGDASNHANCYQSVTDDDVVASAVAYRFGKGKGRVYVFELEVPVISLVEPEKLLPRGNKKSCFYAHQFGGGGGIWRFTDPALERLVPFAIPPQWIKDVRWARSAPTSIVYPSGHWSIDAMERSKR
ncbi:hypothetical protein ACFL6C_11845, partial [Myxococcota bacterium]